LVDWSRTVDDLDLKNARATKRVKEKVKIAADKGFFTSIRNQLCSHREQLTLVVAMMGA
jgi:hypothetical protein